MRRARWIAAIVGGVAALAAAGILAWNVLDRGPAVAPVRAAAAGLDLSRLLVLVDGDMAATGYADGRIYPIAEAGDLLVTLDDPGADDPVRREIPAGNTVMGWPGAMATDPAGRFAYVVEGRRSPPDGVERLDDVFAQMPTGTALTTIDLATGDVVSTIDVCLRPNSIDVAPDGGWLLVACGDEEGEFTMVPLAGGQPSTPRRFDLDLPDLTLRGEIDAGLSYAMIHPGGGAAAYIRANRGVGLVRFALDDDGVPVSAEAEPPVLDDAAAWLTVGRWTRSGGHFLVADVEWGPAPIGALLVTDGQVHSYALSPQDERRGIVSSAAVSKSPEAIELNRDGTRLVAVNMERTYLPGGVLALAPGRRASSLSLVAVDDASGALETVGEPVGFRGVLPEDAVFDADGDRIAVVVYQDHDAPRSDGWVELFAVEDDAIVPTGRRIPMPRGAHDLVALDR